MMAANMMRFRMHKEDLITATIFVKETPQGRWVWACLNEGFEFDDGNPLDSEYDASECAMLYMGTYGYSFDINNC